MFLSELQPGQTGQVSACCSGCLLSRRLMDLGLTPGTQVCCLFSGGRGRIAAYRLRGTVVALRARDAAAISLESYAK